ncbi:hypothetical protein F0562_010109 [Nyssa sinensis]|uniref:Ataxin 2 SM domain-containing protein n=1 Tax=Nyssa sinensis TaxID=561372 RepID=A0A5J5A0T0_9ASTE|nr:hypothetical protein F0562_010109 [Nyssa sinensis]
MGRRIREFSEEDNAVSASLGDVLLFTTMCIVGLPVDVHVKDGSVYSGIFHTACVENGYGIVLKRARMTKKGNRAANVANGVLVETLVVLSEDLVQVVVKGVLLPADGVAGNVAEDDIGAISGTVSSLECAEMEIKLRKPNKSNVERKQISQTRSSVKIENGSAGGLTATLMHHLGNAPEGENGKSDGIYLVKKEEASSVQVNERQVGDGRSQGKQGDHEEKSEFQMEETTHEVQGSGSSLDACLIQSNAIGEIQAKMASKLLPNGAPRDSSAPSLVRLDNQCQERQSSDDIPYSDTISSCVSTSVTSVADISSESHLISLSIPTEMVPSKNPGSNITAKEFKLNPGAKIFCPSFTNHRLTPLAAPTVASVTYIPDNCPVVPITAPQPEVEISPFTSRPSLPVKFVPYGNLMVANGGSDSHYPQPVRIIEPYFFLIPYTSFGHVGSRQQPVRYAGQYHSVQTGPAYIHPNSQNVMVGRLGGQLVYWHPVSHDVTQAPSCRKCSSSSIAVVCDSTFYSHRTAALCSAEPHPPYTTVMSCYTSYSSPRNYWFLWHQVSVNIFVYCHLKKFSFPPKFWLIVKLRIKF